MRSMWKGSISFGLVTIPVKLYAATEVKAVRFNLLHNECRTPVQYKKWCPVHEREVAMEEIVKGYEYERGRYVLVEDDDFESIPIAAARTLDIVDFVKLEQIDPVYYERTYYLEPGEGGAKAYALLRRAMEETGRIALARVVIRTKESLAAIRVFKNGVLAMETMHFPDEIRSPAGLTGIIEPELRPQEMEMAVNLVASMSAGDFQPEKFRNEYRQAMLELIEAKVTGEEPATAAPQPDRGRVVDLMDALRASIRQAETTRADDGAAVAETPGAGFAAPGPGAPAGPGPGPHVPVPPGPGPGVPGAAGPPGPGRGFAPPGVPGVAGPGFSPGPAVPGPLPVPGGPGPRPAAPGPGMAPGPRPAAAGPGMSPGPRPGAVPGPLPIPAPPGPLPGPR